MRQCGRAGVADLRNEQTWSIARQIVKVMDQMHLVVVSEAVRDINPAALRLHELDIESRLKPRHTRKEFWSYTHLLHEPSLEVTAAQAVSHCNVRDGKHSSQREDIGCRRDHGLVE